MIDILDSLPRNKVELFDDVSYALACLHGDELNYIACMSFREIEQELGTYSKYVLAAGEFIDNVPTLKFLFNLLPDGLPAPEAGVETETA